MKKPNNAPPDEALQKLAALVNAKLPEGAMVNFYRIENPDEPAQTGMIFSFGGHRKVVVKPGRPGDDSADQIVRWINDWIGSTPPASKWTDNVKEADSLNWNE
jgi:hypothetical protein